MCTTKKNICMFCVYDAKAAQQQCFVSAMELSWRRCFIYLSSCRLCYTYVYIYIVTTNVRALNGLCIYNNSEETCRQPQSVRVYIKTYWRLSLSSASTPQALVSGRFNSKHYDWMGVCVCGVCWGRAVCLFICTNAPFPHPIQCAINNLSNRNDRLDWCIYVYT